MTIGILIILALGNTYFDSSGSYISTKTTAVLLQKSAEVIGPHRDVLVANRDYPGFIETCALRRKPSSL